jgi:dolichol-phosphate mannosyltransferase
MLQSCHMHHEPVSIVVPTYREAENIPTLVGRVFAAMTQAGIPAEMLIVDDDSRDGTDFAVGNLGPEFPVRLITRLGERGLSSAVVRGFHEARHDILLCMDADLSHPPESVPAVIAPIAENRAEFCIGSRYTSGGRTRENWGLLRKLNSLGATWLARPLTSATDPMAGFFCLRREVLKRAEQAGLNPIGYKIGLEILVKAKCRTILEVPIEFSDRLHGRSKLTVRQQLLYLRHLVHLYRFCWPTALPAGLTLCGALLLLAIVLMLF